MLSPTIAILNCSIAVACALLLKRKQQHKACEQLPAEEGNANFGTSAPGTDTQATAQLAVQWQPERDELAHELQHLRRFSRTESALRRDASHVQELVHGLQQLREITEETHAAAGRAEHIRSNLGTLHTSQQLPSVVSCESSGPVETTTAPAGTGLMLQDGQLNSWGSGIGSARMTISEGGAPSSFPRDTSLPISLQAVWGGLGAAPACDSIPGTPTATLEEWGSGLWARPGSSDVGAAGQQQVPAGLAVTAPGVAVRIGSRLAVSSSGMAGGLDTWGSGTSPTHTQLHMSFSEVTNLPAGLQQPAHMQQEDASIIDAMHKQLLNAQQLMQGLQQQVSQQQSEKQLLEQQRVRQQQVQQVLQQQLAHLQQSARQQEEQASVSEEIISRMQGLASRLGSIRMPREGTGGAGAL